MSIDLHCHTRYSDGSTPLEELIQLAALRGVTTFALTDHDTMAGCECALELGREAGVTVIPGVEISAADPKRHGKAHILCYKPKKPEVLLPLLQKTTDSRHAAMLRSVDKVCRLYAVPREMILRRAEGSTNIYKQHVLQALMDAGYANEMFGEVFKKLYDSKTGIAYEKVDYPDIDTVMDAVDAAEGIAVLAHPSEYHSMDLLRELCRNHRIRGIEVYHPRNTEEDKAEMLRTDYHGFYTTKKNPVGTFTTAESEFDKLFSE